jgi:hypothetical protein
MYVLVLCIYVYEFDETLVCIMIPSTSSLLESLVIGPLLTMVVL